MIIPAYNEAEALPFTLKPLISIKRHLERGFDQPSAVHSTNSATSLERTISQLSALNVMIRHIHVVDNGSEDETASIADRLGARVIYCGQRGYGNACLSGIDTLYYNPPDLVVFMDADGADDPRDLPALLSPICLEGYDFVIGSRVRDAERGALTPVQKFGNALSCFLISSLFSVTYTDLGPFRVLKWETLSALRMGDRNFGWTVEMQTKAAKRGVRSIEIPVRYRRRHAGQSKISGQLSGSIKAGVKILWTIGRERLLPPKSHELSSTPHTLEPSPLHQYRVCVLAKAPRSGFVKTRLTSQYTPDEATEVHRWCVEELLSRLKKYPLTLYVDHPHPFWAQFESQLTISSQSSGDLGRRLITVLEREDPHLESASMIILGTDSPTLPYTLIDQAISDLTDPDGPEVVIGPACDGGYYLIGIGAQCLNTQIWRPLFQEIDWGTDRVLDQTLERAHEANLTLSLLPYWYDIDTPEDLDRLIQQRTARPPLHCPLPQFLTPLLSSTDE